MNRRIQFGSGSLHLPPPWENFDSECDISKPLHFPDGCATFLVASHVLEHVTIQQGWNFLEECHRILQVGGVVRIAIPDIDKMQEDMTDEYMRAVQSGGYGDGSYKSAIKASCFCHGHKTMWIRGSLLVVMDAIGFQVQGRPYGASDYPELQNVEQHGKTVGEAVARVETSCVEGMK